MSAPLSLTSIGPRLELLPKLASVRYVALVKYVWEHLEAVDDAIDAVGEAQVIEQAKQLYDRYVAPADVPWIPASFEPVLIDEPAKLILGYLILGFHALIHTEG